MPFRDSASATYCANVNVLAEANALSLHDVSREVYDLFVGQDEQAHAGGPHPYWSKTIVTGPIEIALFTFEPPHSSQADADQSPASQKNQSTRLLGCSASAWGE